MTDQKNELVEVIQIAGLEQNKVESLMSSFSQSYQTARQFVEASRSITVKDENDVAGMKKAREARLSLRKIRTDVEHTRVSLKEQSLRESRAIDGAERAKLLAPDKEKLLSLAADLEAYALPAVASKEANAVIRATEVMIGKMTSYIREKAKAL